MNLIFLKLGGSLITDKDRAETVNFPVLENCLSQVAEFLHLEPETRLVLGHGSGSFGHNAAKAYGTRQGVKSHEDWLGYAKVWRSARKLNDYFIDACSQFDLPVVDFPVSASAISLNGKIVEWELESMEASLQRGLIPVVHGDVCIDRALGGTILSTEDIFQHLAVKFKPNLILLAGTIKGVYADFPINQTLLEMIPADENLTTRLQGSSSTDVTGGMRSKVELMQAMIRSQPGMQARIFSGLAEGAVLDALLQQPVGSLIR